MLTDIYVTKVKPVISNHKSVTYIFNYLFI